MLLAAAAGAGLAKSFNAPIAAAVFVFDKLVRGFDLAMPVLPGCFPSIRDEAPQNGFEQFFFEISRLKSQQDGYKSPTIRSLIWWTQGEHRPIR